MTVGIVKFSDEGAADQPSPSIWRDCRMSLLNDLGLGFYAAYEGFGAATGIAISGGSRPTIGDFEVTCDLTTVFSNILPVDEEGGRIDIEVQNTDNMSAIVHTGVGPGFALNSGHKVWFEARVALGDVDDQGFFVGMSEEDALGDPILDDAVLLAAQSAFGFFVKSSVPAEVDIMFTLDSSTAVTLVDNATESSAFTGAGGTSLVWPVANTYKKFGMKFDGLSTLEFYIDGFLVHSLTLVSGTHAVGVALAPVIAIKTGDTQAESMNISFARYAHQIRT